MSDKTTESIPNTTPKNKPASKRSNQSELEPLDLSLFTSHNIQDLPLTERNYLILYFYMIRGYNQQVIATAFHIKQSTVSHIVNELKQDKHIKSQLVDVWQKDISVEMRRKASQVVESINSDNLPDSSKAMTAGILIDKSRLIDGEHTQSIAVLHADLKDLDREIESLERALGSDYQIIDNGTGTEGAGAKIE